MSTTNPQEHPALALLREIEWSSTQEWQGKTGACCPSCRWLKEPHGKREHAPTCALAAILAGRKPAVFFDSGPPCEHAREVHGLDGQRGWAIPAGHQCGTSPPDTLPVLDRVDLAFKRAENNLVARLDAFVAEEVARAAADEREACAALAKSLRLTGPNLSAAMADYIADAIRARGQR